MNLDGLLRLGSNEMAVALLREALEWYGDRTGFYVMVAREIHEAYPALLDKRWDALTAGQQIRIAETVHLKVWRKHRQQITKSIVTRHTGGGLVPSR
jgi:hypothetical protein